MLIVGPSNSGKTCLLLRLLLENYFDFERLIICSQSLFQPEYRILIKALESNLHLSQIKEFFNQQSNITDYEKAIDILGKANKNKNKIKVLTFEDPINLPYPADLPKMKTLVILDDILTADQTQVSQYFSQGRHSGFNIVYLSQNYFKLKRQTIRCNANFFIFFKLNKLDFQHIWTDLCSFDFPQYEIFEELLKKIFKEKYDFFTINLEENDITKKYSTNFSIEMMRSLEQELTDRAKIIYRASNAQRENLKSFSDYKLGFDQVQVKNIETFKPIVDATRSANKSTEDKLIKTENELRSSATKDATEIINVIRKEDENTALKQSKGKVSQQKISNALSRENMDSFCLTKIGDRVCFNLFFNIQEQTSSDFCDRNHIIDNNHEFIFKDNMITAKVAKIVRSWSISTELLKLLTETNLSIKDMKAIEDYAKIVDFCIGNLIRSVKRQSDISGTEEDREKRKEILTILDQSEKFRLVIRPNIRGGEGIKSYIKPPKIIVVPNDQSEQYDRLSVILGSRTAGSTADSFNEFTAILDVLLKNGKIPIKIYRTFLKRYHDLD